MQKIKLLCSLIHENITTAGFLDLHQHQNLLTQVKSGIFFKWERLGADLTKYLRRGVKSLLEGNKVIASFLKV